MVTRSSCVRRMRSCLELSIRIANRSFNPKFISIVNRRAMSGRSYKDAIDLLNTLQSNAATLEAVKASGGQTSDLAIPEMIEYLERIGYKVRCCLYKQMPRLHICQQEDLNSLSVIHVTGTKGKGSTCAFVDSILRHTKPEWKIGASLLSGQCSRSSMLSPLGRFVHLTTHGCSAGANTCQRGSHL
jgi:hypothetical protein